MSSMAPTILYGVICMAMILIHLPHITQSASSQALALLSFKANITSDPQNILANWTENSLVCSWKGITCITHHVSRLDLSNFQLSGTISPQIGGLRYLRYFNLSHNQFFGPIPTQLSFCSLLDTIDLQENYLVGSLPSSLGNLSRLSYLDMSYNNLTGSIPNSIGTLSKLRTLDLSYNLLTGTIPVSLSNCSLLRTLNLDANILSGSVPEELGRLHRLETLILGTLVGQAVGVGDFANNLTGPIPASLSNCTNLRILSINRNKLSGSIPDSWAGLKSLQNFSFWQNQFTGTLPVSLANCTQLLFVDLGDNSLTGTIPSEYGYLANLDSLHLGNNRLTGSIPSSLGNCTNLQYKLWLHGNSLTGQIPDSIWTLYKLTSLVLMNNYLIGEIPPQIGNLSELIYLYLGNNSFSGNLPSSLGQLKNVQALYLHANKFEGPIPETLGLCSQLSRLYLHTNKLSGQVPSSLGNLTQLTRLLLYSNTLSGNMPETLGNKLQWLYLQRNNFSGTISGTVVSLSNLLYLDLSNNLLYGGVPRLCGSTIFQIMSIKLSGNALSGSIPESLENCVYLQSLDLSSNNISGAIPGFLSSMTSLHFLNLSNNILSGSVPDNGIFLNASEAFLDGNTGLCGTVVNKTCPATSTNTQNLSYRYIIIIVVAAIAFLAVISCCLWYYYHHRPKSFPDEGDALLPQHMKFDMDDLVKATDNFNESNILGSGGFSIVYKGIIGENQLIAVKKMNMTNIDQTRKGFFRELETLGKLQHRNLVKILGYCNTLDMMAIVLQYMPKGSLKDHLYNADPASLDWNRRLNIAIGVAQGLVYLHHECRDPIAHCDIKPQNILLDDDFEAHIADFGIARLIDDGTISSIKGTIGYVAPELAHGSPTPMSDIYSYGMLLVELVTRTQPTDRSSLFLESGDGMEAYLNRIMSSDVNKLVDETIAKDAMALESASKVLKIAAMCLAYNPKIRPSITSVLIRLMAIRDENNGHRQSTSLDALINEPSPYPPTLTGSSGTPESDFKSKIPLDHGR